MKRRSPEIDIIFIDNDMSEKAIEVSYINKKKLYGITKEQFLEIAAKNNNCCAACGESAGDYVHTLNVDHNKYTNEIRGLICTGCNTAAEWLADSPENAERLAQYLRTKGTGLFIPDTE